MKKVTFLIGGTLLCAAAFAQPVAAQGDKAMPPKSSATVTAAFESLDKNADQQISKTEAAADKAVADNFASADANGDGYLNKSEFAAVKGRT